MISKNQIKLVRSLGMKKVRDEQRLFIAEGEKLVGDLLPHFDCESLFVTPECALQHHFAAAQTVSHDEMHRLSQLTALTSVLAVFRQPDYKFSVDSLRSELILVLDEIQNPGNLGTIVRIADWFGIHHIVCSPSTADIYNPKSVQATMGALARVQVHYADLPSFLADYQSLGLHIYGTFLDGENLYQKNLAACGAIIFGNEGNGVSQRVAAFAGEHLLIPNYPAGALTSESLNVAVAAAVVCAEFRRRLI